MVGPLFLSPESSRCGTHSTRSRQQPPSAWQASFNPSQPVLPVCGEVAECCVRLGIACECYLALVECLNDSDRVPPDFLKARIGALNRCTY
jgi:hypothetical protein